MDRSSYFVKNKALFGSYPSQEQVNLFETFGVKFFIDLTFTGEKRIIPYKTNCEYIQYPIQDRRVPTDWKRFAQFIIKIGNIIKNLDDNEWIYLHCKGGHGRSGVVVACLLCYLYKMHPSDALSKTSRYHSRRKEMREKWRKMGSPQTRSQKYFVAKFFEPLFIYNNYTTYFSTGFNNDSDFSVMIPGFGLFPTATSAFNAFKDPNNIKYVGSLEMTLDIDEIYRISSTCNVRKDWEKIRESIMYLVLKHKFDQHKIIRNNLISTGLRPIIVLSDDVFWGRLEGVGHNMLGKLLMKLRKNLYDNN
jgi:predicted NAD-dependent protein-ADP-ribosyltransferase YbiA (DUF1768 family)